MTTGAVYGPGIYMGTSASVSLGTIEKLEVVIRKGKIFSEIIH